MRQKQFWVQDPHSINFLKPFPSTSDTREQQLNSITVLILYISILFLILFRSFLPLYIGVLVIGIVAIFYYTALGGADSVRDTAYFHPHPHHPTHPEGFENQIRLPIPDNPFMNVPIQDYDEKQVYQDYERYKEPQQQTRPLARAVNNEVEDQFKLGLFQNPSGKLWERVNSQRQFYSVPVGSVPNDQSEFAQNLYGKQEGVCKAGSIYANLGPVETPDTLLCNGWNVSTPTNFNSH